MWMVRTPQICELLLSLCSISTYHFHCFCPALCCVSATLTLASKKKKTSLPLETDQLWCTQWLETFNMVPWYEEPAPATRMLMKHLLTNHYRNHHWVLLVLINILLLLCQIWFLSCILYWTCAEASWFSRNKQKQTVMFDFSRFLWVFISFCLMWLKLQAGCYWNISFVQL